MIKLEEFISTIVSLASERDSWDWNCEQLEAAFPENSLQANSDSNDRKDYALSSENIDISVYIEDRKIDWISLNLDFVDDANHLSQEEYNSSVGILKLKFDQFLARLESKLGKSHTNNDTTPAEVVDFYCALQIATWSFKNTEVVLKIEHQDPDVPIILDIVITGSGLSVQA